MNSILARLRNSPTLARVVPFAVFLALTGCQNLFGDPARYWIYVLKTVAGAWMLWAVRPAVAEMRWTVSWEALAVGAAVFVMWVGLDGAYPKLDVLMPKLGLAKAPSAADQAAAVWNPHSTFGQDALLAWFFIVARILGSSLVVPPMEEVFFRSFLCRYLAKPDFQSVPLGHFAWLPFVATSVLFGLEHREWLAGILCGFAYQGLVCWKKRLGDAIVAHATTNLLLGLWVIGKGAWQFW